MSVRPIAYPTAKELRDFTGATGLRPALVIRDIVRIVEMFSLLDKENLGSRAVLTGGMALRLFASTRVSLRDLDIAIVGSGASLTLEELEVLLTYEDEGVTVTPTSPEKWKRRDLYSAAPLQFVHRFNQVVLAESDRWIKVDVSLRPSELKPLPMAFIHGYPFKLGVEGEIVQVVHPVELLAEKAVAYGIYRVPKHLADLTYMATRLPTFLKQKDWLRKNADEILRVAKIKFDANVERHPKVLEEQGIGVFDDMRESFEHPEQFGVEAGYQSQVFFHGQAAAGFTYKNSAIVVRGLIVPVLWPN